MKTFTELGLRPELCRAVEAVGYTTPSPIQLQAIPAVLEGSDVLASAQTGTGKTAAFALPILQRLSDVAAKSRAPRALILCPTRELADQINTSIRKYGRDLRLRHSTIFGGVGANPQIEKLRRGTDIIVATPGRLLDLHQQGHADLSKIETLVLDEADRMLDMGFIHDIKRILKVLPKEKQNLLFSATFSKDIERLARSLLRDPLNIEVAPKNTAAEAVTQHVILLPKADKRRMLSAFIRGQHWRQTLVFTKTKHGANRLAKQLESDGLTAAAIHGNKSQSARTKALEGFKAGDIDVLVATDIAARGIDIKELPQVVNYELPHVSEDYVHRIGRTGRASASGQALSLVEPEERKLLKGVERLLKRKLPEMEIPADVQHAYDSTPRPAESERELERPARSNHGRGRAAPSGRNPGKRGSSPGDRAGGSTGRASSRSSGKGSRHNNTDASGRRSDGRPNNSSNAGVSRSDTRSSTDHPAPRRRRRRRPSGTRTPA